jgi:hypothetical protein
MVQEHLNNPNIATPRFTHNTFLGLCRQLTWPRYIHRSWTPIQKLQCRFVPDLDRQGITWQILTLMRPRNFRAYPQLLDVFY